MNFFGVEITDAQFAAAMIVAQDTQEPIGSDALNVAVRKALGFEVGDVAAPAAESDSQKTIVSKSDINHES